jgi:hypothetical protein
MTKPSVLGKQACRQARMFVWLAAVRLACRRELGFPAAVFAAYLPTLARLPRENRSALSEVLAKEPDDHVQRVTRFREL